MGYISCPIIALSSVYHYAAHFLLPFVSECCSPMRVICPAKFPAPRPTILIVLLLSSGLIVA